MNDISKKSTLLYVFAILIITLSSLAQEKDGGNLTKGLLLEAQHVVRTISFENSLATLIFEETFETGGTNWSRRGSWAIGAPTSGPDGGYNSTNCAATNLSGNYSDNTSDSLRSPSISLPVLGSATQITLQFWEWYQIESGYDYGYVRISTNGGTSWILLNSRTGSSSWQLTQIDLSSYANRSIIIMFHFTSDGSVTYPGWYVDNIQITKNDPEPITATLSSLNSQNFPFVYMNIGVDTFGRGIATLNQSNLEVHENNVRQTDYFQVVPPDTGGGVRLTDIVFLMDNSGSMDEEIAAVRNNMIAFVNSLVSSGVNFALGLCRFGASWNSGYPIIEDNGNLTTDANYFKNTVWSRNVIDGSFEPGWDALFTSANSFNFRPGSQKVFILITDENVTQHGNQGQRSQQDAIQILQNRSILTFALIDSSNSYSRQDYCSVAQATTGACYNIYTPFDVILERIGSLISNTYIVSYRSSNPVMDGTVRNVQVRVTYQGNSDTANGSYIPGSAPSIQRTAGTIALHNQPWAEGTTFNVEAEIVDNVSPFIQSARLYYRTTGTGTYSSVAMTRQTGNVYRGVIPGSSVRTPGLDYYITATDGISTSSDPRTDPASQPYQLGILPNIAPDITHTPVTTLTPGTPITVTTTIVDNTNSLASAKLFYRKTGQLLYQQVTMTNVSGNNYQAVIPASYVTTDGVDYYIYAVDNFGVSSTYGTPSAPITLKNPMAYIREKEEIINYFHGEDFYSNAEQQAQQYVNELESKVNSHVHTNKDIESVRRLTLVEEAAKVAYPGAMEIAQLSAKTTMQLATAVSIELIFRGLAKVLEPLKNWAGTKHVYKGVQNLVDKFKAFRNSIRLKVTTQIGNRASGILQNTLGLSLSDAQSAGMTLANKVYNIAENEIADQAAQRIVSWTGFTGLESAVRNTYLKTYEDGIPIYLSTISPRSGLFYIGGTEKAIMFSISDARGERFTEGNIDLVTQSIRQSRFPRIASDNARTVQSINSSIDFTEMIGKLSLATIIIVSVAAVIIGIVSCPAGGFGCVVAAIGGLGIWGSVSLLLSFFHVTQIATYSWATGEGIYRLHYSIPSQLQDVRHLAFDRSPTASMRNHFAANNEMRLESIPVYWTDSLLSISILANQKLMLMRTYIQDDRWTEAQSAFDSLSIYLDKISNNQNIVNDILGVAYLYNASRRTESDSLLYYTSAYSSANDIGIGFSQFGIGYALLVKPGGAEKDSILALIDSCIARMQTVAPKYRLTLDQFNSWGFQIPPIVSILDARMRIDDSRYLLVTRIKNISNTTVSHVVASVRSDLKEDLRLTPLTDTLINTLSSSEERELIWQVEYFGRHRILMLEIDIHPLVLPGDFQGARYSISEIMDVDKSPATSGPLANEKIYAYPNPFNPETEGTKFRFNLGKDGNVTISVYDASNVKLKEVITSMPMSAGVEQSIIWNGRNERGDIVANGVYFYVIESSSGERAVGKVAVLR